MKYVILGFGPTETEIMEALWAYGPLTVRQVRAVIQAHRKIAYTTILTVSSHLEEKGLITRHTTGAAYNGVTHAYARRHACGVAHPNHAGSLSQLERQCRRPRCCAGRAWSHRCISLMSKPRLKPRLSGSALR